MPVKKLLQSDIMSKKILLIKAEFPARYFLPFPPPQGLLYLGAIGEKEGCTVDILDLRLYTRKNASKVIKKKLKNKYDIIGFSALSTNAADFKKITKYCRKLAPNSLFLAGGPLANSEPELCLQQCPIDICCFGEGEIIFQNILRHFPDLSAIKDLPGTAFLDPQNKIKKNPPQAFIENLDEIPFPAWHLVNLSLYPARLAPSVNPIRQTGHIVSSRGCPYRCSFCHNIHGKKFRSRSPQNIVREIKILRKTYGIKQFSSLDDCFNHDKDRFKAFLRLFIKELPDCQLIFPGGLRGDTLDFETIALIKKANTPYLLVAIETVSPKRQRLIKKNLNFPKLVKNIKEIKRQGIHVSGSFMVGFPGEKKWEIEKTLRLASSSLVDFPSIFIVIPFRGTSLWDEISPEMQEILSTQYLDDLKGYNGIDGLSEVPSRELAKRASWICRKKLLQIKNWPLILNGFIGAMIWKTSINIRLMMENISHKTSTGHD